jgi:hypothetical protein
MIKKQSHRDGRRTLRPNDTLHDPSPVPSSIGEPSESMLQAAKRSISLSSRLSSQNSVIFFNRFQPISKQFKEVQSISKQKNVSLMLRVAGRPSPDTGHSSLLLHQIAPDCGKLR